MPAADQPRFSSSLLTVLYLEFVLTGAVTTLMAPLIPYFVRRCAMSDADAGLMIAAQFAGNFVGAFFANRNLGSSIVTGMPLIAIGVAGFAFSSCAFKDLCAACYGLGLGLTISAINLTIASHRPSSRAYSLTLLNFLWGAGAVGSPVLIGWAQRRDLLSGVLLGMSTAALALWLATITSGGLALARVRKTRVDSGWYSPSLIFFATLFFLYIGVETSVANWAAPYALRMQHTGDWISISSVAYFWLALLAGRIICAVALRRVPEGRVYGCALVLTLIGASLLISAQSGNQVLIATSMTGFGLGPMFPLLLSFASGSLLSRRNSGWVFSCAALGGAVLPWLTGRVSSGFSSLRIGFIVPASAMVLIMTLSLVRAKQPGYRTFWSASTQEESARES
jgi:fucose permease